MTMLANRIATRPVSLRLSTAAEIMRTSPLSFDVSDSIGKVAALLAFHDLDAAPVTDESGHLIGMVTADSCSAWEEFSQRSSPLKFLPVQLDDTNVMEIVSPAVDSVRDDAFAWEITDRFDRPHVRRLYVVNAENKLIGVINKAEALQDLRYVRKPLSDR